MARIRTVKPEFFTSEDIVSLSPLARLLYIATWCEADKEGRMVWKPKTFKMRYLPGDKCNIEDLCNELVAAGLVVLYGDGLAHIPGFTRHQHVNPRESKSILPEPPTHVERVPSHIPVEVREYVMNRDGGKCVRCGSTESPQLDHILPQSCGGPHLVENLRVLCRSCNAGRPVAGKALEEDLARDGFSVQMLRVKFGIDASIPDVRAQGGREGKGKEGVSARDAQEMSVPDLVAEGVEEGHAVAWVKVRKEKGAPKLSRLAWDAVKREATEVHMTPADAVRLAAESGWQGFKAAWAIKAGVVKANGNADDWKREAV